MKNPTIFLRIGAIGATLLFSAIAQLESSAQTTVEIPPPKPATPVELNQADLLKSYLQVREQLHAAELAITNNRLEAEAAARAQTAVITEKLDALKMEMTAERQRQQMASEQSAVERDQQLVAAQEMNRIVLWVGVAFGSAALLTMLATTLLQWRGIKKMAETAAHYHQLPAPGTSALVSAEKGLLPGGTVDLSNRRLMSAIDRMEQRILELEHTTVSPATGPASAPMADDLLPGSSTETYTDSAKIAALLGKGRSLLNANKPQEAVMCYDQILTLDENHTEALVKKGAALERLKKDLEALDCYDRAIKADQNLALAYLSKGGVFNRLQRFDEAVECYERALQVEKTSSVVARVTVSGDWSANGSSVSV